MRSKRYQRGFWNFVLPAIAAVGSAVIGSKGQKDANASNAALAREQMQWNSEEAEKARVFNAHQADVSRDWQEKQIRGAQDYATQMSATAYQRAVGDLRAAGLNPMLAYSQGSASSPNVSPGSGATASGPAAQSHAASSRQESTATAGLNAAAAAIQLSNIQKQGQNIDADTALKAAQAARETASAGNLKQQTEKLVTGDIPKVRKEILLIEENIQSERTKQQAEMARTLLAKVQSAVETERIDYVTAQTALNKVETILKQLEVPAASAFAEKFKGDFGKDVSPYLKEVIDILRALVFVRQTGPLGR